MKRKIKKSKAYIEIKEKLERIHKMDLPISNAIDMEKEKNYLELSHLFIALKKLDVLIDEVFDYLYENQLSYDFIVYPLAKKKGLVYLNLISCEEAMLIKEAKCFKNVDSFNDLGLERFCLN